MSDNAYDGRTKLVQAFLLTSDLEKAARDACGHFGPKVPPTLVAILERELRIGNSRLSMSIEDGIEDEDED